MPGATTSMASLTAPPQIRQEFVDVKRHIATSDGRYKLLWAAGIRDLEQLNISKPGEFYQPASSFEFGQENAVGRVERR